VAAQLAASQEGLRSMSEWVIVMESICGEPEVETKYEHTTFSTLLSKQYAVIYAITLTLVIESQKCFSLVSSLDSNDLRVILHYCPACPEIVNSLFLLGTEGI
jgi:hypothetical protein